MSGLISGLAVALPIGALVGMYSEPGIQHAIHGVAGGVGGAAVIGAVAGSTGGIFASRQGISSVYCAAGMTAGCLLATASVLVWRFGAGNWPG